MIASHSCCRFVDCTSMMWISRSTTSQRCSIGLRSGDCGDHLSKVNSLSCSRNQSEMIWALWRCIILLIKGWTWSLVVTSGYLSYCCLSIICNQSAHSPLTSDINKTFSSTQLPLTGYFLFFGPFSVNPRDQARAEGGGGCLSTCPFATWCPKCPFVKAIFYFILLNTLLWRPAQSNY